MLQSKSLSSSTLESFQNTFFTFIPNFAKLTFYLFSAFTCFLVTNSPFLILFLPFQNHFQDFWVCFYPINCQWSQWYNTKLPRNIPSFFCNNTSETIKSFPIRATYHITKLFIRLSHQPPFISICHSSTALNDCNVPKTLPTCWSLNSFPFFIKIWIACSLSFS